MLLSRPIQRGVITYRQPVASVLQGNGINLNPHSLSHYGLDPRRREASEQKDVLFMELLASLIDLFKSTEDLIGQNLFRLIADQLWLEPPQRPRPERLPLDLHRRRGKESEIRRTHRIAAEGHAIGQLLVDPDAIGRRPARPASATALERWGRLSRESTKKGNPKRARVWHLLQGVPRLLVGLPVEETN